MTNLALPLDWDEIRNFYIFGKKVQSSSGNWISSDVTLKSVAQHFNIEYSKILKQSKRYNWEALRTKYKAELSKNRLMSEFSIYAQETATNEVNALTACAKLSDLANFYIEKTYGNILDHIKSDAALSDLSLELLDNVTTTGDSAFLKSLSASAKIVNDVYKLQRQIYDNAPKADVDVDETSAGRSGTLTPEARNAKLKALEKELGFTFEIDLK